jgi:uncharacterized protein (TIGR00730 family)
MVFSQPSESFQADLAKLLEQLPDKQHGELIQLALSTIVRMAGEEIDRLDWKLCNAALRDLEQAFTTFYPYRHVRKVAIFGSARIAAGTPEYEMTVNFAQRVVKQGLMVITGAGGGIMQAGNEGAGREMSFGLNIQLPFEQGANPFIEGDPKLLPFKYFFTRKVFFLRESDALALFPGGFGTQDEAFECLTLGQTGKSSPVPLVLIDKPGGNYWHDWNDYIHKQLLARGLISPEDPSIYTITDRLDVACDAITHFYRVFHSCHYVGDRLVIRLNSEIPDAGVAELNTTFADILVKGQIEKRPPLPPAQGIQGTPDDSVGVSYLLLYFNQRDLGRLYQLIGEINRLGLPREAVNHPERK